MEREKLCKISKKKDKKYVNNVETMGRKINSKLVEK